MLTASAIPTCCSRCLGSAERRSEGLDRREGLKTSPLSQDLTPVYRPVGPTFKSRFHCPLDGREDKHGQTPGQENVAPQSYDKEDVVPARWEGGLPMMIQVCTFMVVGVFDGTLSLPYFNL